jgi:hypothetical protein
MGSTLPAMRWLARILGGLVLLALLALGALWWRLDRLAERMIERGGTARLGVATEVDGLLLRPLSGVLTLRGLRVANPPGFAGDFLHVERARGELDVATLRAEVVEVPAIVLSGVELALEETPGGSNYDAILANLARAPEDPAAAEGGPSVRVRELLIRDVVAHVRVAPAPPVTLAIPEIRLEELGGPGGTSAGQVTAQVVRAILVAVATEAPGVPIALAGRLLTGLGLSGAAELLRDAGERGLDAARDALRRILE